jgi:hypothetical protein
MLPETPIPFDAGESPVFVATRDVRNSDHANSTLPAGARVFFRQDRDGSVTLADAATGEPTNGNQYAVFATPADAAAFAARAGLVAEQD